MIKAIVPTMVSVDIAVRNISDEDKANNMDNTPQNAEAIMAIIFMDSSCSIPAEDEISKQ